MSVCAAIGAIVLGVRSAHGFWVAALVLLVLALGLAVRALLLPGAEKIGPPLAGMLAARAIDDDETIEADLLEDLATETSANDQALARKYPLFFAAVTLLVLAIVLELAGVQ